MLRNAKQLVGLKLGAMDGELGRIRDFLFDDQHWTVRYLVADTGSWLLGRQVLVSPYSLEPLNVQESLVPVRLTMEQIEQGPPISSDLPVSRQHEMEFADHYGWPNYWYGPLAWGASAYPTVDMSQPEPTEERPSENDPHLRSTGAISGYHIGAQDGDIGHVDDFIIDDETWAIRYLVIDTRNWWFGKQVLISPEWIDSVDWESMKVHVNLTKEAIKEAPEYDDLEVTREYESALHRHYEQPAYWERASAAQARADHH